MEGEVGSIDTKSILENELSGKAEGKEKPAWWNCALTLGHLEAKMHAAAILDSDKEFKQALMVYARKIAEEGFRGKAEEVVKEFLGPIYWCVLFLCPSLHAMSLIVWLVLTCRDP